MATNAFNRYNTVPALLAYLNKQQRKQFTDSFDVTNLVQTSNYFEKLSIAPTIDNIELLCFNPYSIGFWVLVGLNFTIICKSLR